MDLTPIVIGLCLREQEELDTALLAMAEGDGAAKASATTAHIKMMALANALRKPHPIMVLP